MAITDSGGIEQDVHRLEPLLRWHSVVDGQGSEQGDTVGGVRLAGVLVENLVVEVAAEGPVVIPERVGRGIEQHRGLRRMLVCQTVGDDVPEDPSDWRPEDATGRPSLVKVGGGRVVRIRSSHSFDYVPSR
ncbi:hypothetical protein [Streptomyces sp. NPDC018000]|uniref:hypothetical protein n=1 Tax=Streptomyces sp. NPDC018000 TaxID=3365028 RepID=UPI0037973591